MFKDDDEEEENTFGVTRYPCMPSLVALQQMRNRLHLAFLGRKLMKWTALATGREMRKLATELYDVYQGFGEDMRNAFILLARGRYFCPQLNYIVTENISRQAGVVVQQSTKTVSAVKIVQFEIFETEATPYAHLGLEKGGQTILEAKKAWLELLKRLIMMMQLRASFLMVELANKNATKKWNVLSKLVIPRLNLSSRYILSELEEIEREDNFRLKRFKELKIKKAKGKEQPVKAKGNPCECSPNLVTKALDPISVTNSNICNTICEEHIIEEEKQELNSLEKGDDIKLKEICSLCKTDKEKIKSNMEVNDKDSCATCKSLKDNENVKVDSKVSKEICSTCEIHENKTNELKETKDNKTICSACSDRAMSKEKNIDLDKKDSKFSKNILEDECIYCKMKDQTDKPKIQICKECHRSNTKSEVNNIINDKRTVNNDNMCPACIGRGVNDKKSIVKLSENIMGKGECSYCKNKQETTNKPSVNKMNKICPACASGVTSKEKGIDLSKKASKLSETKLNNCLYCNNKQITGQPKFGACQECQKTNIESETNNIIDKKESCPLCGKIKSIIFIDQRDMASPTESTLFTESKTRDLNKKCSNCKRAELDRDQKVVDEPECFYCKQKGQSTAKSKIKLCAKCQLTENKDNKKMNNSDNRCPACMDYLMDGGKASKLSKITLSKEDCLYCKNKEQINNKTNIGICDECRRTKNITDDKENCPACSKAKRIIFIDQRDVISPDESTLSTANESKEHNKMCSNCKKHEIDKAQTEICQLCDRNRTKSNLKIDEFCSECKNKFEKKTPDTCALCKSKSHEQRAYTKENCNCGCAQKSKNDIKEQKSKSCPNCNTPKAENVSTCACSNMTKISAQFKNTDKNISNVCSSCGKAYESKESIPNDTQSCKCNKNGAINKQDILNTSANSDVRGTFKEIVKIKRFSGVDGVTHEHITVTSKKTQKRILPEPAGCGNSNNNNNNNKCMKKTKSDNTSLNKRNGILKICSNISSEPTSDVCLSLCSEKQSKNSSSEFASITSQSFSCTPPTNKLKTCGSEVNTDIKSKKTDSCMSCKNTEEIDSNWSDTSSKMSCKTCGKDKGRRNVKNVKSYSNNNNSKLKLVIKDDKCKDNSDDEEIELTPSTIVILKKILSRTSKSVDSCKSCDKEENKSTDSKCACGAQQNLLKCVCKKKDCRCSSKASASLKIKLVKSEPCIKSHRTESTYKKHSNDKPVCGTCGEQNTDSKHNKNTCNKCGQGTPNMSEISTPIEQSTPTGSCQECNKKKNKSNCDCNKSSCKCSKMSESDERQCSCSNKQKVTQQKACRCNDTKSKEASKCSSVESKFSSCCGEDNTTSSMANQTCLMDRISVKKSDSATSICNKQISDSTSCNVCKPAENDLKDDCSCSKQKQPQPKTSTCSCQSASKNTCQSSSTNKKRGCSCGSTKKNMKDECQCAKQNQLPSGSCSCQSVNKHSKSGECCSSSKNSKEDVCKCSKANRAQPKTDTCNCQSGNKNPSNYCNKPRECSCKSLRKDSKDDCSCSKQKVEPKACSCQVNKNDQARECSCKSPKKKNDTCKFKLQDKSPCSCNKTDSKEQAVQKEQNVCKKQESTGCSCKKDKKLEKETQKCSCSSSKQAKSKTGVTFENKSSCPCKSIGSGQKLKIDSTKPCSCKSDNKSVKPCGKDAESTSSCTCKPKTSLIYSVHSDKSTSISSQTCCFPDSKPEKCTKLSDKASSTLKGKSTTSITSKGSNVSIKSQVKSIECLCGRKDAATLTRRSDRYDVRTLRQLNIPVGPKNVSCACKSDSALICNKPKNSYRLGRCQSLHYNRCCLRQ